MRLLTYISDSVRVLFVLALTITVLSCAKDDPADPGPVHPTPLLDSLSSIVLSPGDTLLIIGENFLPVLSSNRVRFANSLASVAPFFATEDTLIVRVPQWAATGPLQVTTSGSTSSPVTVEIVRGIGDVWVIGGAKSYSFKLPDTGNESYLFIPHSVSTSGGSNSGYQITPQTTSSYPTPLMAERGKGTVTLPEAFEISIRQQFIEHVQSKSGQVSPIAKAAPVTTPAAQATFNVLKCTNCSTGDPASYATVNASLVYTGANVLIYADDNMPSGGFSPTDYNDLGSQFDVQTFPTDTTHFGPPTDIDSNGRILVLFTPVVNDLTPPGTAGSGFISGFFLVNDLAPNIFTTANSAEIFYSMVPDPNNEHGNTFSTNTVKQIMPATLAHEFEHMISFGYRFIVAGNGTSFSHTQQTWLEEGMAHMAEDLNGFTSSNQNRLNLYLIDPGNVSLFGSDTLEQRGGIFLFLRYLTDQLGEGVLKPMTRSICQGRACVQSVSGEDFFVTVADFLATLFLDGTGVTLNPRYNYTSNVNLNVLATAIASRSVSDGAFSSSVRGASGDFVEMDGIQSPATNFSVSNSSGNVRVLVVRTR